MKVKVPYGLHIGTRVSAARFCATHLTTGVVIGYLGGARPWGVVIEFVDGYRDVAAIQFVSKVK